MVERIYLALETPVGFFLIVLMAALCCLLVVYGVIVLQKRRRDAYRHRNAAYFAAAEAAAPGYVSVGQHHGVFFGRETHVQDASGSHFSCLIMPPESVSSIVCSRFQEFIHRLEERWPHTFVTYTLVNTDERIMVIQDKLIVADGKALMPLTAYVKDKRFTTVDKEKVLMTIAHAMAQLHHEKLYHGFLLPTSIFLDTDATHRLTHVVIADIGFAYAIGAKTLYQKIQELKQGKLPIEKYRREEYLSLLQLLAPEQVDVSLLSDVGTPGDFYAFASMAVYLFTGNRSGTQIKWEQIPERWRPFLERCLRAHPGDRPRDFAELEEWVEDPDVALTIRSADLDLSILSPEGQHVEMATLAETIQHDHVEVLPKKRTRRRSGEEAMSLSDCLLAGASAMKMGRWEVAKGHYDAALIIEQEHPESLLKLAVCVYELGDMKAAELYLNAAAAKDPSATKTFQQHIAFRI